MQHIHELQAHAMAQENLLRRYFVENKISADLGQCIWRFLSKHHFAKRKKYHEKDFAAMFSSLPHHLLSKLHEELYTPLLTLVPFFETYALGCSAGMSEICHRACTPRSLDLGEAVFLDGQPGESMYFVKAGKLAYTPSLELHQRHFLEDGAWACEPSLWMQWIHCGRLMSDMKSEVIVLNAERFRMVVTSEYHMIGRDYCTFYAACFADFIMRLQDNWRDDLCADKHGLESMAKQAKNDVLTLLVSDPDHDQAGDRASQLTRSTQISLSPASRGGLVARLRGGISRTWSSSPGRTSGSHGTSTSWNSHRGSRSTTVTGDEISRVSNRSSAATHGVIPEEVEIFHGTADASLRLGDGSEPLYGDSPFESLKAEKA